MSVRPAGAGGGSHRGRYGHDRRPFRDGGLREHLCRVIERERRRQRRPDRIAGAHADDRAAHPLLGAEGAAGLPSGSAEGTPRTRVSTHREHVAITELEDEGLLVITVHLHSIFFYRLLCKRVVLTSCTHLQILQPLILLVCCSLFFGSPRITF